MAYNFNSKELFINLSPKDIPPKTHPDYLALRDLEKKKCIEGVNINGIHIWGSLYYHCNHHKIELDEQDSRGKTIRVIRTPKFRDNEWIFHEAYNLAVSNKKGLLMGSARQLLKSESIVSLTMRELFLYQNTEAVGVFTTKPDKETFAKKALVAIQNTTDFLVVPNIDKDLTKEYIRFGLTQADNEPFVYSKLFLYLNSQGNNSEISAGKSISFFFMDEIGKNNCKETYEAVLPAIEGDYGLRCSSLMVFTAGDTEKVADAKGMFFNPESNKCQEFINEGKKTGFFMSGHYKMGFKEPVNFINWYNKRSDSNISNTGELATLDFTATNFELANNTLDKELLTAKNESLVAFQKRKMYAPRNLSDMFLQMNQNRFGHLVEEFERLLVYLENTNPQAVDLIGDEKTGVTFKFSNKPILTDYPVSKNEEYKKDSAFVILDPPRLQGSSKLYVVGLDNINTNKSNLDASLGSFYIMRKETSDYSDEYGGRIVAWYNGRKDISHFRKILLQAMILYGAVEGGCTLLHEASDDSLTQWFTEKNLGYMLEDTYGLSKEINPNTQVASGKGMRPTLRNQDYYLSRLLDYCEEELPDGRLGLWRIPDPYLVKQLMQFDGDLGVCDSIVAAGHTIMHFFKERRFKTQIYKESKPEKKKNIFGNAFGFHNIFSNFESSSQKSII
jgi:hypothetical protein